MGPWAPPCDSYGSGGHKELRPRKRPRTAGKAAAAAAAPAAPRAASEHSSPPRARRGRLRAVLFDFDATLTAREELHVWRLFPERGGFRTEIDRGWLREKGFGGEERILQLGRMLGELAQSGAELHIVSFADREVIVRALAILGALHFFRDRIVGWEELDGGQTPKSTFILELMQKKGWRRDEVLFVDDQEANIRGAEAYCLTHRTKGWGLTAEEMRAITGRALSSDEASSSTHFCGEGAVTVQPPPSLQQQGQQHDDNPEEDAELAIAIAASLEDRGQFLEERGVEVDEVGVGGLPLLRTATAAAAAAVGAAGRCDGGDLLQEEEPAGGRVELPLCAPPAAEAPLDVLTLPAAPWGGAARPTEQQRDEG